MFGLPIASDKDAHPILPNPLNNPIKPTIVAAAITDIPVTSCAKGEAIEITAIPQVTLINSIIHKK